MKMYGVLNFITVKSSLPSNIRRSVSVHPPQPLLSQFLRLCIGVDLDGILRGTHGERRRWVGAEWGVGYGEACPLSSQLGALEERRELPQRGPGCSGRKRTLAYFEGHRMLLFVSIRQKFEGDNLH